MRKDIEHEALTWSGRTRVTASQILAGRKHGWQAALSFAGPAFVASVAYIDPGNFATNIQAGAQYGYQLLWVVLLANIIAMLFQSLSAKLGIVTGKSLAEHCRDLLPRPLSVLMWIISEIGAMATDLAEFLGAAVGLSLLFHLPIWIGLFITGLITYAILILQKLGFRPLELVIASFVILVGGCYIAELWIVPLDWQALGIGMFVPHLPDSESLMLAVGIVGATVMPHAIYLHSGLPQHRVPLTSDEDRQKVIFFSNREVLIALTFAGLINLSMVAMSAGVFHASGRHDIAELETAYQTLIPLLGGGAAAIFLISLIASGLSSSVVGTLAGQMIMQDFVHWRIPLFIRRLVTMAPAFVIVALGVSTTKALIISQVILSFVLPLPMLALVWLTSRRATMGSFTNRPLMVILTLVASLLILTLNGFLIFDFWQALG